MLYELGGPAWCKTLRLIHLAFSQADGEGGQNRIYALSSDLLDDEVPRSTHTTPCHALPRHTHLLAPRGCVSTLYPLSVSTPVASSVRFTPAERARTHTQTTDPQTPRGHGARARAGRTPGGAQGAHSESTPEHSGSTSEADVDSE